MPSGAHLHRPACSPRVQPCARGTEPLYCIRRYFAPFLWVFRRELKAFTRADIWESFKLPLLGNVLFYCLLTICIRLAGAPLAGMFMAVIPVLVAIASNIRYAGSKSAVAWSKILPPLAVIFFGLIVANLTEFERCCRLC